MEGTSTWYSKPIQGFDLGAPTMLLLSGELGGISYLLDSCSIIL